MIRDRVKELRRVRAADLVPHPENWRTHPTRQQQAIRGVLAEVGYADALVARELPDGRLQLIDGHLRAETTPEVVVPVLIVELNDDEAAKVLLTHDPVGAMAGADKRGLEALLHKATAQEEGVKRLLDHLAEKSGLHAADPLAGREPLDIPESYQVVAECRDEAHQHELYHRLKEEGLTCRVMTL